jgi:hypothetical protein
MARGYVDRRRCSDCHRRNNLGHFYFNIIKIAEIRALDGILWAWGNDPGGTLGLEDDTVRKVSIR